MSACCTGTRAGYHREWWYIVGGEVTYKGDQAGAEQAQRDNGGAGRIERRVVADT